MRNLLLMTAACTLLSGCGVAKTTGKIVTAPVKVVGKTAEVAGKGVYYTGKGVYKTGEAMGKTVYYTGKGMYLTGKGIYKVGEFAGYTAYRIGSVPVNITNAALDSVNTVLSITETTIDIAGKAYTLYREIPRTELDAYIKALKSAKNVVEVVIDAFPEKQP